MPDDRPSPAKSPRFAVYGFYGNENLGDEAIVEAVIDNIRELIPGAELTCISVNPVDSRVRHKVAADSIFLPAKEYRSHRERIAEEGFAISQGPKVSQEIAHNPSFRQKVKSLPVVRRCISLVRGVIGIPTVFARERRFVSHIRAVLNRTEALLISGSNQFLDNFGGWSQFPYTLWMWTFFAKRAKVPVVFISVGAGPIFSALSMRLICRAIRRADYLSLRDTGSVELLGLEATSTRVMPDLAFSHKSATVTSALSRDFSLDRAPVVGINPMAVHARGYWYEVDDEKFTAYVNKLAQLVQELEHKGNEFILVANQPRDELVINEVIEAAVSNGSSRAELESRFHMSTTVEEYLQNASKADIIIATRFHATVLGLLLARPVIGLCYYKKSAELLREFALGDHAYDIDKFSSEDVIKSIGALGKNYEPCARSVASRVIDYRAQLRMQYETVSRIVLPQS
jgi:polysaccharide pyruvyl transferase WcaK-like protein